MSLLAGNCLTTVSTVDSQLTCGITSHHQLHTALTGCQLLLTATADGNLLCSFGSDQIEYTVYHSTFVAVCLFGVAETCLLSHYQVMAGFVSHHVKIHIFTVRHVELMHNSNTNVTKVKCHYGNTVCGSLITFSAKIMHPSNLSKVTFIPMFAEEWHYGVHRHKHPYHAETPHSTWLAFFTKIVSIKILSRGNFVYMRNHVVKSVGTNIHIMSHHIQL
jgi:hypothetical protein